MALNKFMSIFMGACLVASAITAQATTGMPKHMVFTSDTQYPWTDKTDIREPESDSEFTARSKWLIETQLASIAEFRNQHGSQAQVPLMINGYNRFWSWLAALVHEGFAEQALQW